jgi:hypothetical protein
MKRIRELIEEIKRRYPGDNFFANFETNDPIYQANKKEYLAYNRALMALDNESWNVLREKAVAKFHSNQREGQKKQGFFNILNEAFAYKYLTKKGFTNVSFVKEENGKNAPKKPDLIFNIKDTQAYCEVKTLGISNDEISRRQKIKKFGWAPVPYHDWVNLSNEFLETKFSNPIEIAQQQMGALGNNNLIYIIIRFDDSSLNYYPNYRRKLIKFCKEQKYHNLFIKIGILGNKRIFIK